MSGSRRRGFTLIELMIVVALIGVATASAVIGLRAWRRTSQLQKALSGVIALLDRASAETLDRAVPYQITAAPDGLVGGRWELDSTNAGSAVFRTAPPDAEVRLDTGLFARPVTPAPSPAGWVLERGPRATAFRIEVWHAELFPSGYIVSLEPTGRVSLAPAVIAAP